MENTSEKILLAVDFQEQSIIALEYAMYFAKNTNSEIVLLHVIEENGFIKKLFSSSEQAVKYNHEVQKSLDEIAAKLSSEFKVSTIIKYGKPYEKVIETANEILPKFILMGKTESPSLSKKIAGSNTTHTIFECKVPVISVRGKNYVKDFSSANKNIIVPLDLTKPVREQLIAAIEFSKFLGSHIHLFSVIEGQSISHEIEIKTRMNKAQKYVENAGIKCETKLMIKPTEPLCALINEYGKEIETHLVVIMTQAEEGLKEFFIGSHAKSIIDLCDFPVLSVVPWEAKAEATLFKSVYDPLNIFDK